MIGPVVRALCEDNYRVYGSRKVWKAARRGGHDVGRDQVGRLMRAEGIEGVRRTKRVRTTRPGASVPRHPDLVGRDFSATAPNQLWVTDLAIGRRSARRCTERPWLARSRRIAAVNRDWVGPRHREPADGASFGHRGMTATAADASSPSSDRADRRAVAISAAEPSAASDRTSWRFTPSEVTITPRISWSAQRHSPIHG